MAINRTPAIATESFLLPVFDGAGTVRTTRLVAPGEQVDLADSEVTALGAKATRAVPSPPDAPAAPGP